MTIENNNEKEQNIFDRMDNLEEKSQAKNVLYLGDMADILRQQIRDAIAQIKEGQVDPKAPKGSALSGIYWGPPGIYKSKSQIEQMREHADGLDPEARLEYLKANLDIIYDYPKLGLEAWSGFEKLSPQDVMVLTEAIVHKHDEMQKTLREKSRDDDFGLER